MTDHLLHQPRAVDLQRAAAFVIAQARSDDELTAIYEDAAAEGRELMLTLAVGFLFVQFSGLANDVQGMATLAQFATTLAAMDGADGQ